MNEEPRDIGSDDAAPVQQARPLVLSQALRERTAEPHTRAERTGIVNDILRGKASRDGYVLLLRNLLPAYEAMEQGLERHRTSAGVGKFARREIYRSGALHADLAALAGDDWMRDLPLLPAGRQYGKRVAEASRGDGARLIAHAYARYLGDLSGGQILKTLLGRSLGLTDTALSFYDFPKIADHKVFKAEFRDALDRAGEEVADIDSVIEEGAVAFELNIDVSNAVQAAAKDAAY